MKLAIKRKHNYLLKLSMAMSLKLQNLSVTCTKCILNSVFVILNVWEWKNRLVMARHSYLEIFAGFGKK